MLVALGQQYSTMSGRNPLFVILYTYITLIASMQEHQNRGENTRDRLSAQFCYTGFEIGFRFLGSGSSTGIGASESSIISFTSPSIGTTI